MEVVLQLISLLLLMVPILTWNIETRTPVIFSGFQNSYFGFSVALHNNSRGHFALVSATRANSTFEARKSLHQPGVLYKCDIISAKCEEVILEQTANNVSYVGRPMSYVAKEDDMWLGVSLDVQSTDNGYILTCGHLWKNQHYQKHYLTNGACYIIDREFNRSSYKILLPLIHRDKQTINNTYYYAFALAGISATFTENGADMLLGAPGVYDWFGTVVSYSIPDNPQYAMLPIVPDPPGSEQPSPEAYIGYSVTTGKFFEFGGMQFVAGAPRDGNNMGRVYVFESLHHNNREMIVLHKLQGEKVGEYFGASVLGVNVNGDSYTDLFVGSPFYSLPNGGDEGKVYVYLSNGVGLSKYRELMGSKTPASRFGTTIANAGDLNQDGFLDVAIGAPYEDDKGAVYVYHGNSNGIDEKYAQRIAADDINPSLSGFGISISKAKDIDDNYYPDILVGSYASDNAVLFRTRPIVNVSGRIVFDPPQIDTNSSVCTWNYNLVPCFNVSFCLKYVGNHVPDHLGISTELTSARQRETLKSRRYLLNRETSLLSSYIRQNITLTKDKSSCFHNPAYVFSDPKDFISPIQMTLTFQLSHDVTKEERFCKTCPMLHPDVPTTIIGRVTFQTGCGEDSICVSDLMVTVNVHGLSSGELVVGQDNVILLVIELQNLKEPAYMTDLLVYLPSDVQIINQDNCRDSQYSSSFTTIFCEAGNPLKRGHVAKFEIKLDTKHVSIKRENLIIKVNSTTASQEANPENNHVHITIPLKVLADITIIGFPATEQIIFGKKQIEVDTVDVEHVYTVLKFLPSPVNSVSVDILVPTTFKDNDVDFLQLRRIKINEGNSGFAVPASCNSSIIDIKPGPSGYDVNVTVPEIEVITVLPTKVHPQISTPRPKRSVRSVKENPGALSSTTTRQSGHYANHILDCITTRCTRISCIAGPFTDRSLSANFRIYGAINLTLLQTTLKQWDKITVVTEGKVAIRDPKGNIQPVNHRPDETTVTTTLEHSSPLPAQRIAIWIIVVSVLAGILLLVLISWGLIKLGFFRRKKKEDMEKMMMNGKIEEWKPDTDKNVSSNDTRTC